MKLDYLFIRNARSLMKAVDVLSDHARDFALRDQMSDRAMASIGLGLGDSFVDGDFSAPRFASCFFRGYELAKVDWLVFSPDAAGASKVGNAGFGADARAGEDDRAAALGKKCSQV